MGSQILIVDGSHPEMRFLSKPFRGLIVYTSFEQALREFRVGSSLRFPRML